MALKLTIAAVGKLKSGPESELYERYAKRFQQAGRTVGFSTLNLSEFPESRAQTADLRKQDEGRRLLGVGGAQPYRIVLAESGASMTSEAFAAQLSRLASQGTQDAVFIIGGPDGHGIEVLNAANLKLSLGAMTMTHGLARVVLAEQMYRAATILSGHPYHRA